MRAIETHKITCKGELEKALVDLEKEIGRFPPTTQKRIERLKQKKASGKVLTGDEQSYIFGIARFLTIRSTNERRNSR